MIRLDLNLDRANLPLNQPATRHLLARVTAAAFGARGALPPLDLALVIDASSSMSGAPLAAAKEAAAQVARSLAAHDRLTLVSFADDVIVHVEGEAMDAAGQERALLALQRLRIRGSTDLAAGWLSACNLLAGDDKEPRRRHVVVLSDGRANRGLLDPGRLAQEAERFLARGVTTTAIGIGEGYSPHQLSALADGGGGRLHDAEHAGEIAELVLGEVLSLAGIAAEGCELVLDLGAAAEGAFELSGARTRAADRELCIPLGSLFSGVTRTSVVRLELPASLEALELRGHLRWRRPGGAAIERTPEARLELSRGGPDSPPPSLEDARAVVTAWEAHLVARVADLNRAQDFEALERLAAEELPRFRAYAEHHPETRARIRHVERLFERSRRPMPERNLKLMFDLGRKETRAERAHHRVSKGGWADHIG